MRVLCVVVLLCLALAQVELASVAGKAKDGKNLQRQLLKHTRYTRQHKPPPPNRKDERALRDVKTEWLDQLLDHFDPTVGRTWRQRYFSNPELYQEGGPIFIFIEGEAEANPGWIDAGGSYMYEMAKLFKAKMYVLEHRFFGSSRPTSDISTANLKWLTSDQALADLAYFIEYLTEKGEMMKGQKLAVFGGSYPGNLAAWARIKYAHLIDAAVASSAPVHAEEDFPEYFEVVTRSIRTIGGDECANNLDKAFKRIKKLVMTDDGLSTIKDLFYMCDALDTSNKLDIDFFYEVLSNPFATAAQYNREGYGDTYSLKAQCDFMVGDMNEDEAVEALANVFVSSMGFIWSCIDWGYASNTQGLSNTYYGEGDRQWVYMTCTSFGYFQTADGDTVFPKGYFDVPFFIQQCKDAFGDEYDDMMAKKGVNRTNIVFGDVTPDVTNVMFVNGEIDPWHSLSVLEDINESSPAVLISSTSHCYDMYPNMEGDPEELLAAREKVKQFLLNALYNSANGETASLAP